jgi:hypothetical protein
VHRSQRGRVMAARAEARQCESQPLTFACLAGNRSADAHGGGALNVGPELTALSVLYAAVARLSCLDASMSMWV